MEGDFCALRRLHHVRGEILRLIRVRVVGEGHVESFTREYPHAGCANAARAAEDQRQFLIQSNSLLG
jgi:hypothetical protein